MTTIYLVVGFSRIHAGIFAIAQIQLKTQSCMYTFLLLQTFERMCETVNRIFALTNNEKEKVSC